MLAKPQELDYPFSGFIRISLVFFTRSVDYAVGCWVLAAGRSFKDSKPLCRYTVTEVLAEGFLQNLGSLLGGSSIKHPTLVQHLRVQHLLHDMFKACGLGFSSMPLMAAGDLRASAVQFKGQRSPAA